MKTPPLSPTFIPPRGTLFAITRTPIRPVVLHGALFKGGIPVCDNAEFIITEEEGEAMVEFRRDHRVVLLRCHGTIVVGGSLEEVAFTSFMLEENAEMHYQAASLDELDPMRPHVVEQFFIPTLPPHFKGGGPLPLYLPGFRGTLIASP